MRLIGIIKKHDTVLDAEKRTTVPVQQAVSKGMEKLQLEKAKALIGMDKKLPDHADVIADISLQIMRCLFHR